MTILVSRPLGLGDFFTGLPALAMLRSARPGERIVLAVPDEYRELALLSGSVDATVHGHELEPLRHPPERPDVAIDLHGFGPASRALLAATHPVRLVAFGLGGVEWDPTEHEVARWCRLLREGLPMGDAIDPPVRGALSVPPGVVAQPGRTIVHCGAKSGARRWPPERFAKVAAALTRAGHDVVVTGGPGEAATAARIARRGGTDHATSLSIPELVTLVSRARLVISGDTGIAHVASNYATPSVVLFGPVPPARWGPPPDGRHQVVWHGAQFGYRAGEAGDPHAAALDPALAAITVDEVLDAADRALAAIPLPVGVVG